MCSSFYATDVVNIRYTDLDNSESKSLEIIKTLAFAKIKSCRKY